MKREILLAIDGSEMSNKAVDHVADVVGKCKEFSITLMHVLDVPPALREHSGSEDPDEERRLDEELRDNLEEWMREEHGRLEKTLFGPARERLAARGVTEEVAAIHSRVTADVHSDVADAIVQETKRESYVAVVLGRRGESTLKEFLMGTVVHKVVHEVDSCAVWVVS